MEQRTAGFDAGLGELRRDGLKPFPSAH